METIQIGNHSIGENLPTYIIAEIGINHNGDINLAKKLIDSAYAAKVDAVKFQKRDLPSLYQSDVLSNTFKYEQNFQYMIPILKEVELKEEALLELKNYCESKGLEFLCTPFDIKSVDFLMELGVNAFKIASADLNNFELLEYTANQGKPMILSTGMSYWDEIEKTVQLLQQKKVPFSLLHCRSVYPVWPREVNLRMIHKLRQFGCPVGYSGHDIGIVIPLVAASMGACIIEKHITTDKRLPGPDHKISLEPYELKRLVRDIKTADQAVGKDKRFLLRGEILNRELFGKSLLAAQDIRTGTVITREMIKVQGPGKGLSPSKIDNLTGREIQRDILAGDFFIEDDINELKTINFTNSFKTSWGLIARFSDFEKMLSYAPKIIEFHLTEKDLEIPFELNKIYPIELIVHAPEYIGDKLFDLCSLDEKNRNASIEMAKKTRDFAANFSCYFKNTPKIIIHPGAMSLNNKLPKEPLEKNLANSLKEIQCENIELLLENLPPYPWYFGGQWKGNYFIDPDEIVHFCRKNNINICFDLSHAALYTNSKEQKLTEFIKKVKPFIRHIHIADAYGLDGEGVQIGEGDIHFEEIMPLFSDYKGSWIPEIWRGHLQNGKGFIEALMKLEKYSL
ncbi:MAG: N-acetylneuraminate synthase family protein [Desulfobacterales bacterium]|nr:N-acetylneuraminate synthase family protein [Desulfobacterales bacterium]